MFNKIANRKAWTNGKVTIILPCDKKTFRIVDKNDNSRDLFPNRFRSLEAAINFAN